MSEIDFEIIFDKIHVYKNLLKDWQELVEILKNSEKNPEQSLFFKDWQPWSVFGTYVVSTSQHPLGWDVNEKDLNNKIHLKEKYFNDKIKNNFYLTTNHFLSYYDIEKNNDWEVMGPSYAKYFYDNKLLENEENAMIFHTDYVKNNNSEKNFALTCTMYLNDDYEGGELIFKINNKIINYKPKAGEIMVFPSGHPKVLSDSVQYEHAVSKIKKTEKYFIRCFYKI